MTEHDDVVEALLKENIEFKKTRELHSEYGKRLDKLSKKQSLSTDDTVKRKTLKKKKLAAKDKMFAMVKQYKQQGVI